MAFSFQPVDEESVRQFVNWQYGPPYDVYNMDPNESEEMVAYFMQPDIACHIVRDAGGELVAFCTFGPDGQVPGGDYGAEALDIGLGVRPDLTGQGRGHVFVTSVLDFARRTFAPVAFRVTVADFNRRALRVWERAGFQPVQRFERTPDGMGFVVLVRDES
jgi:RimJ/RimL family protein N-acetyltransferase